VVRPGFNRKGLSDPSWLANHKTLSEEEKKMSANLVSPNDRAYEILKNFRATDPEILGCALCSADGYPIASELPSSIDEARVAALAAATHWMGQQVTQDMSQGPLRRVFVEGELGDVIVTSAGPESLVSAIVNKDANLGVVCMEMQNVIEELNEPQTLPTIPAGNQLPVTAGVPLQMLNNELDRIPVGG